MLHCLIMQRAYPGRHLVFPAVLRRNLLRRVFFRAAFSLAVIFSVSFSSSALSPQDRAAEYKAKYEKETDPIRKARALGNYGDWQVDEFVRQANANEYDAA